MKVTNRICIYLQSGYCHEIIEDLSVSYGCED